MKKQRNRESLEQAYREAIYQVDDCDPPLIFKIGGKNTRLDQLLCEHRAEQAVFITAYNPASEQQPEALNRQNHARLGKILEKQGYQTVAGFGCDEAQHWAGEASWLVFDLPVAEADRLARLFGQNAYVLVKVKEAPILYWVD